MIRFANISLGAGDGVSCRLCSSHVEPERFETSEVLLGRVAGVVEGWNGGVGPNVVFTGPEPFRLPGLPEVLRGAVELGVERLGLRTDAGALAHGSNARGCVATGVRHIEVTLLGGQAKTHDSRSGVPGSYEASWRGVDAYREAAASAAVSALVCGLVPVCSHNVKELPEILHAFTDLGARSVMLEIGPDVPTPVVRPWVDAAVETGMVNGVWVSVEGRDVKELRLHRLHALTPALLFDPEAVA